MWTDSNLHESHRERFVSLGYPRRKIKCLSLPWSVKKTLAVPAIKSLYDCFMLERGQRGGMRNGNSEEYTLAWQVPEHKLCARIQWKYFVFAKHRSIRDLIYRYLKKIEKSSLRCRAPQWMWLRSQGMVRWSIGQVTEISYAFWRRILLFTRYGGATCTARIAMFDLSCTCVHISRTGPLGGYTAPVWPDIFREDATIKTPPVQELSTCVVLYL